MSWLAANAKGIVALVMLLALAVARHYNVVVDSDLTNGASALLISFLVWLTTNRPPAPATPAGSVKSDGPKPPAPPNLPRDLKLHGAWAIGLAALLLVVPGCKNAQQAENGVFTGEEILCLTASLAADVLTGQTQQDAEYLVQACKIAPTLTQDVINFINSFQARKAAAKERAMKLHYGDKAP